MVSRQQLLDRSQTDWKRVAATLVITAATSVALYLGITTHSDTRTVVREREVAGAPCFRLTSGPQKGQPSAGCDRLAQLLAETCSSTPALCRETVNQAARRLPPKDRRVFREAVKEGLASTAIRGSITPKESSKARRRKQPTTGERAPSGESAPVVPGVGAPASTPSPKSEASPASPDSSPSPASPPARSEGPVVTTPDAPVITVTVPEVPIPVPTVTVPTVPEVPVVPSVPETPPVAPEVPELGPLRSCRATKGVQPCRPPGNLG